MSFGYRGGVERYGIEHYRFCRSEYFYCAVVYQRIFFCNWRTMPAGTGFGEFPAQYCAVFLCGNYGNLCVRTTPC
ncbi:hypothetical protein JCM10003_2278 [Bacteroides pyogenes JCM 10003]|nr:hypothetical protein JCM10003_2278 [Bacteroides pyogenes JCM 10003]